jgi:hypothetical protein
MVAGFGHLIYPLLLVRRTRDVPTPEPPAMADWPPISVVVPAYLEAAVIREKVNDVLANGYPGELEVVVVADDSATAEAARASSATVLEATDRSGKATALNRGVAAATKDIVVISDANTTLFPGSLTDLVRWFADPRVDAVAGEKRVTGQRGESMYWKFESWLKQREFMTGTTIGLVGELAAIRRDSFRPIPDDVTNDDLWIALDVSARGGLIAYEPGAVAAEQEATLDDEWQRRTRVVSGALDVLWRRRGELLPGGSPVTGQIWGHRLIRITAGPLAHLALLRLSLRSVHRSRVARAFLGANGAAAFALYRQRKGEEVGPIEKAAAQVLWLQLVALGGMSRWLRREPTVLWPKLERAAGDTPGAAQG